MQLQATTDNLIIWSVDAEGRPVACHGVLRVGMSEKTAERLASQAAERSANDYVVTRGVDPSDPRHEVMMAFRAGTSTPYTAADRAHAKQRLAGFKRDLEALTEIAKTGGA